MQKILRRRVWRDLRENLLRYLALGFLIILGMYMIVSLVGAADTIITGVDRRAEANALEEGEFSVFVPLTAAQEQTLSKKGAALEKMFYLDFAQQDGSTLRMFQNRNTLNLVDLDEGRLAQNMGELVLEKRYCEENQLKTGDSIQVGSAVYTITGIGSVPDYDAPYRKFSDSTVDSSTFGLGFVSAEQYEQFKNQGEYAQTEEYVYAYRLNGRLTNEEMKEAVRDFEIEAEEIDDPYFQDYWSETGGKKDDLENGIDELLSGAKELKDGLKELRSNNSSLNQGAGQVFDAYLKEANEGLASYIDETLTDENFEQVLNHLRETSDSGLLRLKLRSVTEQLKSLKSFRDGLAEYTDGVAQGADGSAELADGVQELKDSTDEMLDQYFSIEMSNLIQFIKAEDNPRIKASSADQVINKFSGLIAGIIIMVLFTYVISVFVIHGIEKECSVIGALYALGVRKKDLLVHYLMLPVLVTMIAGVIGTLLGFSPVGVNYQMADCYDYFSIPKLASYYPVYLILYGIVMPPLVSALVNCIVIRKKLSQPALKLISNEQKAGSMRNLNLGSMGFVSRFRIRQMLREARTSFTVIFGMFIALLIMMLAIDCYVMCMHVSTETKADTRFAYMYTYKYPDANVPAGGEACFAKTLKKEIYGYNLDVTVLGIDDHNQYFDAKPVQGKSRAVISSAMAQKYQLSVGDKLILTDEEENMDYAFTVDAVAQYSPGMYVFMDIDSMRELFGEQEDYYNVVFSSQSLDIDAGRLYASTSSEEVSKSSDVFISMMMPMISMMTGVSALIFCVVMYLMMKVMIDRSAFGISLMKIFGYRTREVKKLYLNGNFYLVAVGAAICIPLAKWAMDTLYPLLVSNVGCGMNLSFSLPLYLGIYVAVMGLYLLIHVLLVRRLKKLVPAEVLKNRE